MKVKNKKILPAGTIVIHNGKLLEIGEYSSHRGVYQVYSTNKKNMANCELTKFDLLDDEIEHIPDIRVSIKMHSVNCEIFIDLWRDIRYSRNIQTDGIYIEDQNDAEDFANADVEEILDDIKSEYPLTDEEIEFLKSELTFYYNVYRR